MKEGKATILIVDDIASNIYALENLLAKENRTFLNATSGNEGLKIALSTKVDLIILDVMMPEMDGFEVANMLKSNKRTKDIPILFASAEMTEQKNIVKGLEEGAIDYLFKPLDPEITRAKVNVLLRLELQRKELIENNIALEKSSILINNCFDIICTIDADTLQFEEYNLAVNTLLGYTPEEIATNSLLFFLTPEDKERILHLSKLKQDKVSFETEICCKDGSFKWLHWNIAVKNGKWFCNARDITELKEAEQLKYYLSAVVKQSDDAIYLHDETGTIISWNLGAEKIYGYSENEALLMNMRDTVPPEIFEDTEILIKRILAGERIDNLETKRITKDGRRIDVLFSASLLTESDNADKSIAITERDITERKLADEEIKRLNENLQGNILQLESANKELESFSYSVSHDLRAPLRALNSYTQIIEDEFEQTMDPEAIKLLNNIKRNSHKMGVLIDDLLAFSRLGKQTVQKNTVHMKDLIESVYNELETPYTKGKLTIEKLPDIEADYNLLKQVVINLISNAVKYSSKNAAPVIHVGAYDENNQTVYFIKDNGVGFNMEYMDKLFGVFQRLHSNKEFEGTGVGLAIVSRIVAKHGGRVWAEAKVNEGAVFYFSLPKE